jgi:nitrate reductase NapE component
MNELSDDLLNRFIDGDLTKDEADKVEYLVGKSKENLIRLNALREANRTLKNLEAYETKSNFTSLVMKRIERSLKSKEEQKKFIIIIASVFMILCLTIVGIIGFEMIKNFNPGTSSTVKDSVKYIVSASEFISNLLNSKNISIIGGVFSFGLIISARFFFDYSKMLRKAGK